MSKSKQENKRSARSRVIALTRKQLMAELYRRKDAALAEEVSKRLEPFITAEVTRQIGALANMLKKTLTDREEARMSAGSQPQIVTP